MMWQYTKKLTWIRDIIIHDNKVNHFTHSTATWINCVLISENKRLNEKRFRVQSHIVSRMWQPFNVFAGRAVMMRLPREFLTKRTV